MNSQKPTMFEEMRRKMGTQQEGEQEPIAPDAPTTRFEEMRRKLETESPATAEKIKGAEPVQQAATEQPTMTKFEELRRRLKSQQAAPTSVPTSAPAISVSAPASAPQIAISELTPEKIKEKMLLLQVEPAIDKMSAAVRLHRPADGQPTLTADEMKFIIQRSGVTQGIDESQLERLAALPVYESEQVVANGANPVHGENGKLVYHFDVERQLQPMQDEKGTIDYKNLNYVVNVAEGDVLCDILLPTEAIHGFDVTGKCIPARTGSPVAHPVGENTVLSEDGRQVIAKCAGALRVHGGKLHIVTKLELERVDGTTGNISFAGGSVVVKGEVKAGFHITAGGDITVCGNVEGAQLTAGGSIKLEAGMNGLGSGALSAKKDINAFFLENIDIQAEGSITADVILNCKVSCRGDLLLKGKNASFIGGECTTFGSVKAKDIGNELDVVTKITLIGPRTLIREREELSNHIETNAEEMRKLFKIAESGARPGALIPERRSAERALSELQQIKDATDAMQARVDELQAQIDDFGEPGVVMAWGSMYPNTRMNLDTIKYSNAYLRSSCCAYLEGGEVAFRAGQKI